MNSRGKDGGRKRRLSVDKFRSYTQRLHNREYNKDQQRDRHAGLYSPDCTVTYNTSISNSPPTHKDIIIEDEVMPGTRLSGYSKDKKSLQKKRSSYKREQDNRIPIFPSEEDDEVGAIIGHGMSDEESEGYREAVFRSVEWQHSYRPRLSPERQSGGSPIILSDVDDEDDWGDKWNLRDMYDKRQRIEGCRMPYSQSMRNEERNEYEEMMDNDYDPHWVQKGRRNYKQDDMRKNDRLDRRSDYGSPTYERNHAVDRDSNRKYWHSKQDFHVGDSRGHFDMENCERGMNYDYMRIGKYERKDNTGRRPMPDERPGPCFSRHNGPRVRDECEPDLLPHKIDCSKEGISENNKRNDNVKTNEDSGSVSPLPCRNDNSVLGSSVKSKLEYVDVNRREAPHAFSPIADIDINRREPSLPFGQERHSIERSKLGGHSYDLRREYPNSLSPIPSRRVLQTSLSRVDSSSNRGEPSRSFSPVKPLSEVERSISGIDSHDIRRESLHSSSIPSQKAFKNSLSEEDSLISRRNSPRSFSPIPTKKGLDRIFSRVDSQIRRDSLHSCSPIPSPKSFGRNISEGDAYGNKREPSQSFSPIFLPQAVVERNSSGIDLHDIRREESCHSLSPVQSRKAIERKLSEIDSYGNRREPTQSKSRTKSHRSRTRNPSPLDPYNYRREAQRSVSPAHPCTSSAKRDSYDNRRKKTSRSRSPILHRSERDRRRSRIRSHNTRRELPCSYSPTASARNMSGDPYGNRRERSHSFSPIHSRAVERSMSGLDSHVYRRDRSISPICPGKTLRDSSGLGFQGKSERFISHPPELYNTGEDRNASEVYRYDERRDPSSLLAQSSTGLNPLGVGSGDGGPFSFPPLPPPPPPPPILSTFSSASSFSQSLPVNPSLNVDLDVKQSMQILEKLKKKQEIVSKCDMKIRELYRKKIKLSSEPSAFFLSVNNTEHSTSSVMFCDSALNFNSLLTSSHSQACSSALNPNFSSNQTNLQMSSKQLTYSSLIKHSGPNVLCQPDESSILGKECKGSSDSSERLSLNHMLSIPSQLNSSSNLDCISYQSSSLSVPLTFASSHETEKSHSTSNLENKSKSFGSGWPTSTITLRDMARIKPSGNMSFGPPPPISSHDTPEPVIQPVKRSQPSRSQITLNLLPKSNTSHVSSNEDSSYVNKVEEFLARIQGSAGSHNSREFSRDTVNDFSKSNRNADKPPFLVQTCKKNVNPHENEKLGHEFDKKRPKLHLTSDDVSPKASTSALEYDKFVVLSDEDDDVIYIGESNCQQKLVDNAKAVVGGSANFKTKNSQKQSCTDVIKKETFKSDTGNPVINISPSIEVNLSANYSEKTQSCSDKKDGKTVSRQDITNNAEIITTSSSSLKTIIGPAKEATNISSKIWRANVPKAHLTNLHETKCLKTVESQDDNSSKANSLSYPLLKKPDFCQNKIISSSSGSVSKNSIVEKRRDFSELGDEPPGTSPTRSGSPPIAGVSKPVVFEENPKKDFPTMNQHIIGHSSVFPNLTVKQTSNLTVVIGGKKKPPKQMQTIPKQEKQSHLCANKTNLIVVDSKVSKITPQSSSVIHIVPQSCKLIGSKGNSVEELRDTSLVGNSRNEISSKSNEAENTQNKEVSSDFDLPDSVDEEKQPIKQKLETTPNVQTSYEGFKDIFEEGNEIAKCIEDIQRNDDRLKKVYINTLRNKTINKSLCIMNGMLCLENEKIGARIVASTIEEKIIHYLHCYLQHHNDNLPIILKDYFTPIKELGKKVKTAMKLCIECSKISSSSKKEIDSAEDSELHRKNSDPLSEYVDSDSQSDPMSIVRNIQNSSKHVQNIILRMGKEESELYIIRNKLLLKRCCSGDKNVFKIFVPNDKIKEIILVAHIKFSEHGDLHCVASLLDRQFSPIDLVESHINTVISTCSRCSI